MNAVFWTPRVRLSVQKFKYMPNKHLILQARRGAQGHIRVDALRLVLF